MDACKHSESHGNEDSKNSAARRPSNGRLGDSDAATFRKPSGIGSGTRASLLYRRISMAPGKQTRGLTVVVDWFLRDRRIEHIIASLRYACHLWLPVDDPSIRWLHSVARTTADARESAGLLRFGALQALGEGSAAPTGIQDDPVRCCARTREAKSQHIAVPACLPSWLVGAGVIKNYRPGGSPLALHLATTLPMIPSH
ncbi:hypothetical protein L596_002294 [Steinernema carpocapsae]|uniref:Uncharacterized protein n=1 Tax=Steinernema carpocapsae TaxID=34508 RepID=A0A4U8UPV3_STECR|nr:hypothetical protein L596_002294 [Steinernema carpocapsae]